MRSSMFNLIVVVLVLAAGVMGYAYLAVRDEKESLKNLLRIKLKMRFAIMMGMISACAIGLYFYGRGKIGHGEMEALKNAVVFFWLTMIAWIDWKEKIIPNKLILAALVIWLIMFVIEIVFAKTSFKQLLAFSLLGGGVCGGVLMLISLLVREALGMGDVKMVFVLGLFMGLMNTFAIILLSMIIMSITAVVLLVMKKANRKTAIPMAPFIFFGLTLNLLLGM